MNSIKKYAIKSFENWVEQELEYFLSLLDEQKNCRIVDLGCGDGKLTIKFAKKCKAKETIGVEAIKIDKNKVSKNVKLIKANLNYKLPLPSNYFDVVISHFSLEHLYNSGVFIRETHRILKKGGYTLVATDNLSAWPNIISLLLGWQPFSTTSGVGKKLLGNPLALRANFITDAEVPGEYSHNKVMAYRMLIEAYREYNFKIEKVVGVGYFPFYGFLSRILTKFDKRHSHLLIIKAFKK